ncbi:hypothetical protein ACIGKG_06510 [Streptomyces rochei]|uniref:hypothetical protein n=1 Tax=Streptomyces rochei TaxID=1928 RepID=UPI0037CED699
MALQRIAGASTGRPVVQQFGTHLPARALATRNLIACDTKSKSWSTTASRRRLSGSCAMFAFVGE